MSKLKLYKSIELLAKDLVSKYDPDVDAAKKYLHEGENAPEGVQTQQGPRGGVFYDTDGSTGQSRPESKFGFDQPGEYGDDLGGDIVNHPETKSYVSKFSNQVRDQADSPYDEEVQYGIDDLCSKLATRAAARRLGMKPSDVRMKMMEDEDLTHEISVAAADARDDIEDMVIDEFDRMSAMAEPNEDWGRGGEWR